MWSRRYRGIRAGGREGSGPTHLLPTPTTGWRLNEPTIFQRHKFPAEGIINISIWKNIDKLQRFGGEGKVRSTWQKWSTFSKCSRRLRRPPHLSRAAWPRKSMSRSAHHRRTV